MDWRALLLLAAVAIIPSDAARATTITTTENWERLQFVAGQPFPNFRLYSAAEFSAAIPQWHSTVGLTGSTYAVELQHSRLTWGQAGTNDDFLEIDQILAATSPQIYTSIQLGVADVLQSISVTAQTASRPDLPNAAHAITLFDRIDGGAWHLVGALNVADASGSYPVFSPSVFSLLFPNLSLGHIDLGFGCLGCSATPGAGYLLGDVTISYTTAPVPEPMTLLLISMAGVGGFGMRRTAQRSKGSE